MSPDSPCSFCRILSGDEPAHVVFDDADAVAFLDWAPAATGHTLVVPRQHARTLLDMDPASAGALMSSAARVARLLDRALHPDGLTMLQTNEEAGWQSAFHVHLHLIPRWTGDDLVLPRRPELADERALADTRRRILASA